MMSKLLLWSVILLLPFALFGEDLGIKKPTESVIMYLKEPLDAAGLPGQPDSAHVFSYGDNGTSTLYEATLAWPFLDDSSIDTTKNFDDTSYVFVDDIADIDGSGGNNTIAIWVTLFTAGYPTTTFGHLQIISDSLNAGLINKHYFGLFPGDSVQRISNANCDTLIYFDGGTAVTRVLYWHIGGVAGAPPTGIGIEGI